MKFAKLFTVRLAAFLFLLAGSSLSAGWKEGDRLPDLSAYALDGASLPDLEGKVVLVDFWATWCVPCRASFPVMEKFQQEYGDQGFVIVAISVDESETAFARWGKRQTSSFSVVRDIEQKLVAEAGIEAMPTSFLIGRDGMIRTRHSGFHEGETEAAYRKEIAELLAEPAP